MLCLGVRVSVVHDAAFDMLFLFKRQGTRECPTCVATNRNGYLIIFYIVSGCLIR
jgi:hypothetical protein